MPRKKVNSAGEPQQDVTEMEQSGMEAPALLENPCRDTDGPGADPSAELDEPDDGLPTPENGPGLPGEDMGDTPEVMEVDVSAPPAPPDDSPEDWPPMEPPYAAPDGDSPMDAPDGEPPVDGQEPGPAGDVPMEDEPSAMVEGTPVPEPTPEEPTPRSEERRVGKECRL